MKLKDGDILICSGNGFIPRIIKKVTKSTYSHSAIVAIVRGKLGVIEAQANGINWKPFDAWQEKYGYDFIVYRKRNYTKIEIDFMLDKAFSKAGHTGYDFFSFVIRQPFKLITGKFKYRGEYREVKRMICSEFVAWCYDMPNWWKMTPDDNKKFMDSNRNYYIVK